MSGDLGYTYAKLGEGTQILATHAGRIKERLIAAFNNGGFVMVSPNAMPDEPKRIWGEVWTTVTSLKGTKESGSFAPSIERLSESEAVSLRRVALLHDL